MSAGAQEQDVYLLWRGVAGTAGVAFGGPLAVCAPKRQRGPGGGGGGGWWVAGGGWVVVAYRRPSATRVRLAWLTTPGCELITSYHRDQNSTW